MRHLLLFGFFLVLSHMAAQTAIDALRYSTVQPLGTARTLGVGGSLGPLGGDFGALSQQPAALAQFRRSEMTISPAFGSTNTRGTLKDNPTFNQQDYRFNFGNVGVVLHGAGSGSLSTSNWAFGLNRLANYSGETFYTGTSVGSITERFIELSSGLSQGSLDPFEAQVAFNAGAIYNPNAQNIYKSDYQQAPDAALTRSQRISTLGGIHEWVVGYGATIAEKFQIGVTVNSPTVRYQETKSYNESDRDDLVPFFRGLTWNESLKVRGQGLQLKTGATYRFSHAFRMGVAVHTPSILWLRETFKTDMEYDFIDGSVQGPFEAESPEGEFKYTLQTPWHASVSAAGVVGKKGFVTAEVDLHNPGTARFQFRDASTDDLIYQNELNQSVRDKFRTVATVRLGGELALGTFRARVGGGFVSSALKDDNSVSRYLSTGIGLRFDRTFIDLGVRHSRARAGFNPYLLGIVPERMQEVTTTTRNTLFLLTWGFELGR